jgi:protein gp37
MSDQRDGGIAWCDETWNPVRGCTRVSPGCENCYAERVAARFSGPGLAYEGLARIGKNGPRWTGDVRVIQEHLRDPLKWKRPRRIFVNSMSDLFHEGLGFERDIDPIFAVMGAAERHVFQVLTKRPRRMLEYVLEYERRVQERIPRNIWLGVTAEDQQRVDERIPLLLQTPAVVRFVSVEPQLGPVNLARWTQRHATTTEGDCVSWCPACASARFGGRDPDSRVDWVITGAESGPSARPYDLDWARSLRDQCAAAGAAFFLKQTIVDGRKVSTPALDGVVHAEFPR